MACKDIEGEVAQVREETGLHWYLSSEDSAWQPLVALEHSVLLTVQTIVKSLQPH